MPSELDRSSAFTPPHDQRSLAAGMLSLLAHGLLAAALAWGVNWQHHSPQATFEAELWSSLPQQAAPQQIEPPPPPAPIAKPMPPVNLQILDADIALKKQKEREKQKLQALREEEAKHKLEQQAKLRQQAKLAAQEAKELEKRKLDDKKLAKLRADNLARILGQAGATGGPQATGSTQQSSGPSPGYAGRIRARIKPNIVFTDNIAGNPSAEVEVRTDKDGNVLGTPRLIKSSGNKAWDDAAIKGVIRTQVLPRDMDGRVPSPMIIEFRPKD